MTPSDSQKFLSPSGRATLLLACLRPHLLLPAYLAAAVGLVCRVGSAVETPHPGGMGPAAGVLGWSLVLVGIHVANLLTDRDTDRLNSKNLFWMNHLSPRLLALTAVLLAALGLAVAGLGHPRFLLPVGATLLLGLAYSLRPLILSRRWGWDALANVAGYGILAPWLGALLVGSVGAENGTTAIGTVPGAAVLHLAPLVFASFLLTAVLDRQGDRLAGKRTWAVRFGARNTNALAVGVLVCASLAARFGYPDPGAFPGAGASGPAAWILKPGPAHLGMAVLALLAVLVDFLHLPGRFRRRFLVAAIFAGVLAAGGPALLAWPRLGIPLAGWLVLSYLLLLAAGRIAAHSKP